MNKILKNIIAGTFVLSATLAFATSSVYAATTTNNTDDASSIGTSESSQVKVQSNRTDKGAVEVNQGATDSDSSNLGTSESPQHKKQAERTDKGASKPVKHHHKNKVMKNKDENQGTTMGNKVQPSEPEQAAPAGN